ncbi:hypothetical protein SCA6_013847 [Theobroma cacao]
MGSDSKSNGSDGGGGGGGGGGQIPASVKKVVQDLKEVVGNNCTDSEIYAVLRDCNMDPNEAVQRLLSQDTFHKVKSRRERRKEMKETQELKNRANNGTSNRGVRGGSEHSFGWSGSTKISSNELGKAASRKENASVASIPYSASSTICATGQTLNEQPCPQSNSFNADNRRQSMGTGDMIDSSLQPSLGSQPTRVGATLGHVTMADIVRMGRPQSKGSQMPCETSFIPQDAVLPNSAIYHMKPSDATSPSQPGTHQDLQSSDLDMTFESGKKSRQHDFDNEWPVVEPITASSDIGSTMYSNQSYLYSNRANLSNNCWSDNILVTESDAARENLSSDQTSSAQASSKQIFMNGSEGTPKHDDDLSKNKNSSSPDSYRQIHEHQEGIGRDSHISVPNPTSLSDDAIKAAASAAVNLQQLSLGKEQPAATPTEENCGLVLPNDLQVFSADCSHLSFGTYKSGKSTALSQPQASSSLTKDLEGTFTAPNGPSSVHLTSRDTVNLDEEQLEFAFDNHRAAAAAKSSLAELRKLDIPDAAAHGNDFVFHSSIPGSSFKNIQQLSSAFPSVNAPTARNVSSLPSEVQSYSNSIPSELSAASIQSLKARDSAAYLASQSISSRYCASTSSMKNPTISMSEVLNSGALSVSHPSLLAQHGANLATGPVLKEHLSAHSYSQTGYPAIPQSHTYSPYALQHAYPNGNVFHESFSGMKYNLPQYRSNSMSSLPLSGSYTSGYESLGNSTDIPGSFLHNLSAGPAGSKVGYDDFLRSQYRDGGANFNLLQQNDGSAVWDYVHGSRTTSTIPHSAYYSLQGQNHQLAGYHQGQRHSQLHGFLGYPGVYNSQAGITREQQQQNLGDVILNGSQGPSSKQLPQNWQRRY